MRPERRRCNRPSRSSWSAATCCSALPPESVLQRSHFCTMGCVSDAVLFGSLRRLRVWALAVAVALVGSQALDAAGLVDLGRSVYRQQGWLWAGALPGGLLFGFGMVQAGGCVSRNLVAPRRRAASRRAPLAGGRRSGRGDRARCCRRQGRTADAAADSGRMPLALAIAAAPAGCSACATPGFRRSRDGSRHRAAAGRPDPARLAGRRPGRQRRPDSLNYLALDRPGSCCRWSPARCSVRWPRHWRAASSGSSGSPPRATCGAISSAALLMGVGGSLALGCTIGQGLTGVVDLEPRLLPGAGRHARPAAWWGVKHLETGRLLPSAARAVTWRQQRQSDVADAAD